MFGKADLPFLDAGGWGWEGLFPGLSGGEVPDLRLPGLPGGLRRSRRAELRPSPPASTQRSPCLGPRDLQQTLLKPEVLDPCVIGCLNHATPGYSVRGTELFPPRPSNEKTTARPTTAVWWEGPVLNWKHICIGHVIKLHLIGHAA